MSYGQYKKHQNELPYSVKIGLKGDAKLYNDLQEGKSIIAQGNARRNAITAVSQAWANHLDFKAGTWTPPITKEEVAIQETSIISRIYNWFLNINY